jgi:hypothetical protein
LEYKHTHKSVQHAHTTQYKTAARCLTFKMKI